MMLPEPFDIKKDMLIGLSIMTFFAICILHTAGCVSIKEAKARADLAHDRGYAEGLVRCVEADIRPIEP